MLYPRSTGDCRLITESGTSANIKVIFVALP